MFARRRSYPGLAALLVVALVMVGCAVSTSLAIAPALLLAHDAFIVDLDGPLLLARDREPGLTYEGDEIAPYGPDVWG